MTTTTLQNHPPERGRGYAFNQSGPASPGCPTYGVAVAVQGEDVGWSGRGRVRGRLARVGSGEAGRRPASSGRGAGSEPWQLPSPGAPVPPLPRAGPGRARSRRGRPVQGVRAPHERGQSQITTIVPSADEAGRKVSGPQQSRIRQGWRRRDAEREGDNLKEEGSGSTVRAGPGPGGDARRGRRPRRPPPSLLLPDSVPGTELGDAAGLQSPFPPPPPPPTPLQQTEDAPWRLEACVSSGARESGDLLRGAGDSAAGGARACARAPASVSVWVRARPRGGGVARGGGERPRDARRDRGKILRPRKSVNAGKEDRTRVSLGEAAHRAAAEEEGKSARRARAPDPSLAEPSGARSHRCSRGGARSPRSRCPLSRGAEAARSRHRRRGPDCSTRSGGTERGTARLLRRPWRRRAR
ncbi:dapper homolog 3-like [Macaca thibetana thibetana]|uniref:dapper homolog 3-like n=1 Tax=Macaca thibetana thibetana TaxID=257877 RepID=UPI0021BCC66B|nr:dapper homolog 3-like [Macaca thibetana thibetana]